LNSNFSSLLYSMSVSRKKVLVLVEVAILNDLFLYLESNFLQQRDGFFNIQKESLMEVADPFEALSTLILEIKWFKLFFNTE